MGRGKFKWGPRVDESAQTEIEFECLDGLEEHPSDDENGSPSLVVVSGIDHELSFWDPQQLETSYAEPNNIEAAARCPTSLTLID